MRISIVHRICGVTVTSVSKHLADEKELQEIMLDAIDFSHERESHRFFESETITRYEIALLLIAKGEATYLKKSRSFTIKIEPDLNIVEKD